MSFADEQPRLLKDANPEVIRNHRFTTAFRGYDTAEVRAFLDKVANAISEYSQNASTFVMSVAQSVSPPPNEQSKDLADVSVASEAAAQLALAQARTQSIIAAAKNEANAIVAKANDDAARIILRARAESRGKPSADTMAAVEAALADAPTDPTLAREQARIMISEAKAVRERILTDLAKRRRVAHVQLEQLRVAREKLLESFRDARRVADDASRDLSTAEVEARLAAETAGRRVGVEELPSVAELEAELFSGRSILPSVPRALEGVSAVADHSDEEPISTIAETRADAEAQSNVEAGVKSDVEAEADEATAGDASITVDDLGPAPVAPTRLAQVDDLFARLRAEREQAAANAHVYLSDGPETSRPVKGRRAAKSGTGLVESVIIDLGNGTVSEEVSIIDLTVFDSRAYDSRAYDDESFRVESFQVESFQVESFPVDSFGAGFDSETFESTTVVRPRETVARVAEETDQYAFVRGPLSAQCVRAMKRFLQDEQSSALAALRTARGRVGLEDLLGDANDHRNQFQTIVETFLTDALRAGADAADRVPEEAMVAEVPALAGDLATEVTTSIRSEIQTSLDGEAETRSLNESIAAAYREWSSDRLMECAAPKLQAAFDRGFAS